MKYSMLNSAALSIVIDFWQAFIFVRLVYGAWISVGLCAHTDVDVVTSM